MRLEADKVHLAVGERVLGLAVPLVPLVLALVAAAVGVRGLPVAVVQARLPLALVDLSVPQEQCAFPVRLVVDEFSSVDVAVLV